MVLKFVETKGTRVFEFPFPNAAQRVYGSGQIVVEEGDMSVLAVYDKRTDTLERFCAVGTMMSEMKKDAWYRFFQYYDDKYVWRTFTWNHNEFEVYVENDNGKTVNRLS